MLNRPAPSPSGWDDDPVPTPDWMTEEEWLARCEASLDKEPPPEYEDGFWDPEEIGTVIAEADRAAADEAAAAVHIAVLGAAGRAGAVQPGGEGPTAPSAGPPQQAVSTPPNPPDTPSERSGRPWSAHTGR